MRIHCIVNPASGRSRTYKPTHKTKLQALAQDNYHETSSVEELNHLLGQLSLTANDLLIISGGDGTSHAALTALLHLAGQNPSSIPIVALLPAGSTNLSALDLHGSITLDKALTYLQSTLATASQNWPLARRHLICVQVDEQPSQFGFIFGIGLVSKGVQYFQDRTKAFGSKQEWGAALAIVRAVFALHRREPGFIAPSQGQVIFDNQPSRHLNCTLAIASTLERAVWRLHYHWSKDDAPIHYTEIGTHPPRLIRSLIGIVLNKIPPWLATSDQYRSHSFTQAHFQFTGDFILDGELMTAAKSISLSNSQPIRFLRLGATQGHG